MEVARTRSLVWLAALVLAVSSLALAGSLPAKPPYTNPVTVRSSDPGTTLDGAIRAAARAAGVQVLTKDLPEVRVSVDFKGVPFRDYLDLLLRIYAPSHDYALLPEGVVLVAPKEALKGLLPAKEEKKPAPSTSGEARASVVVPVAPLGEEVVEVAKGLGVTGLYVRGAGALVLTGEASRVAEAAALVRELAGRAKADLPAPPPPPELPKVERAVFRVPEGLSAEELASLAQALGLKATPLKGAGLAVVEGAKEDLERLTSVLEDLASKAPKAPAKVLLTYEVPEGLNPVEVAQAVGKLYPEASVSVTGRLLAVQAPEGVLEGVKGLLEKLRASAKPPAGSTVLTFVLPEGLEGAKAVEALKALYPEAKAAALARVLLLEVPSDRAPGVKEGVENLLAGLAKTLGPEVEKAKGSPAQSYPVKGYPIYGDPKDIAQALGTLFPEGYLREIGGAVQVLAQQKAVVVAAPYEVHRKVVDLLRTIDPPKGEEAEAGEESSVRVALSNLTADKASAYLKAAGLQVDLLPEPSGSALWIKGKGAEVNRALLLLKTADANPPQTRVAVRVVQLERSALDQLSGELTAALQGLSTVFSGLSGLQAGYALPASLARSLSLNLSALESKGLAKTLLNTEVVALDGQEVALNSGGTLYVLSQSGSGSGGGGTDQGTQAPLTQIDYGLILKITPRVVPEPLGANVKVVLELGNLPTGGPISGSIDISKRKLEALLRLKSEETGLIGGLIQEEERSQEGGVPILKDLPLLGALFRSTETRRTERLLLIMLTPTVYDQAAVLKALPSSGEKAEPEPPQDTRTPPEPPAGEGKGGASAAAPVEAGLSSLSASSPVKPSLPKLPPPSPDYSGQAYLTAKGAALYVLGGKTSPIARPLRVYLVRKDGEGKPVGAVEVPFQANRETFGGGSMAVLALQADPESLAVAHEVVLVLEDELGKAWSIYLPLSRAK